MKTMPFDWLRWGNGITILGFLILLALALRMLPATPKARLLKNVTLLWVVITCLWLVLRPHLQ